VNEEDQYGCGNGEETQEHLFEPFLYTKGDQGSGFWDCPHVFTGCQAKRRVIEVESRPGKGVKFRIILPVMKVRKPDRRRVFDRQRFPLVFVETGARSAHYTTAVGARELWVAPVPDPVAAAVPSKASVIGR
jgi:hypothetical protein